MGAYDKLMFTQEFPWTVKNQSGPGSLRCVRKCSIPLLTKLTFSDSVVNTALIGGTKPSLTKNWHNVAMGLFLINGALTIRCIDTSSVQFG